MHIINLMGIISHNNRHMCLSIILLTMVTSEREAMMLKAATSDKVLMTAPVDVETL